MAHSSLLRISRFPVIFTLLLADILCAQNNPLLVSNTQGHSGRVHAIAFLEDEKRFITVSEDKSIRWWDANTGEETDKVFLSSDPGSFGMLYSMDVANNLLVVAGFRPSRDKEENRITILDVNEKKILKTVSGHQGTIQVLEFSNDSHVLVSGGSEGMVILWDVSDVSNASRQGQISLEGEILDLALSLEGNMLSITSGEGSLFQYDVSDPGKPILKKTLKNHFLPVNTLAYDVGGSYLITGGQDGIINLYDKNGKLIKRIDKVEHEVTDVSVSLDGKIVVAMTKVTGTGYSYSLPDGELLAQFNGHDNTAYTASFSLSSSNGNYVVASSGGNGNDLIMWNAVNGSILKNIPGKGSSIWHLSFDENDHLLINRDPRSEQYQHKFDFDELVMSSNPPERIASTSGVSFKQLTPYIIRIGKGITITNHPNYDGRILSVLSGPEETLFIGSDFSLVQYDLNGKRIKEFVGHQGAVRSLALNESFLVSGGEDEMIHFWKLGSESNRPFASLFLEDENNWCLWSEQAYFASEGKGAARFGWLLGGDNLNTPEFYTGEQFFSILYRPDEVSESIQNGESVTDIIRRREGRVFALSKMQRPAAAIFDIPYAEDELNRSFYLRREGLGFISNQGKVKLRVKAYDGGSGIMEILLYQNTKLVKSDEDLQLGNNDFVEKEYDAILLPGDNLFKVVATNLQGVESRADEIHINYTGQAVASADLHVLTIGINEYQNPSYNLNYASPDAHSFVEKIKEATADVFNEVYVHSIYDQEAVKSNILSNFAEIMAEAKPQDVFIFYYAGHGTVDMDNADNEYFLVPHDITQIYGDRKQLDNLGISSTELRELLAGVKAQKQLILLDACHSGGAIEGLFAFRGSPEEKAIIQLARSSGTVLLSASGTQQFATEFAELKHGVFTYTLLAGLNGEADGGTKDGKITVNELKAYMEDMVPQLSEQYGGKSQFPTGFSTGQDFPIAIVNR